MEFIQLLPGSISACAEETQACHQHGRRTRVDLRVRGGDGSLVEIPRCLQGRSPRARRRPQRADHDADVSRSISACAEETRRTTPETRPSRVDLRVRGGDAGFRTTCDKCGGRSPRARRRRSSNTRAYTPTGSISACAEETSAPVVLTTRTKVDLRVRGGDAVM